MKLRENDILSPALLRRFEAEAELDGGDGRFYALILRDDGHNLWSHHLGPQLDPMQSLWAGRVLQFLNHEIHHDGAWVVVFTAPKPPDMEHVLFNPKHTPYGRYVLLWLDQDGDVQFPMDWEQGSTTGLLTFAHVVKQGIEATAQKAEACWQMWHRARQVLDLKKDQTYRRAKGERAPSAH